MALNDDIATLETISENILNRNANGRAPLPEGKRFDEAYATEVLAPLVSLKKIAEQFLTLNLESNTLNAQIANMLAQFQGVNALVDEATLPDETSGWFCFKKTIPGAPYIKKIDKKALKKHLDNAAPFTPSDTLISLGEEVKHLKTLADEADENKAVLQDSYEIFCELYAALHEEEATRISDNSADENRYSAAAHKSIAEAHINMARDLVQHKGIPTPFKSFTDMKETFNNLNAQVVHPRVRTAVAAVAGVLIGAALGFTVGFLLGGVTSIPAMFAGAALFGTLAGMGFGASLVSLMLAPITFFHAKNKVQTKQAHRAIMENEGITIATQKIDNKMAYYTMPRH